MFIVFFIYLFYVVLVVYLLTLNPEELVDVCMQFHFSPFLKVPHDIEQKLMSSLWHFLS